MTEVVNNDLLIIISSKYPTPFLFNNVKKVFDIYKAKICIIDSDSENTEYYDKIREFYNEKDVSIHMIKNKNYEYGAWKSGYEMYPNYTKYLCIQDGISIDRKINLDIIDDYNAYTYFHLSGYYCHMNIKHLAVDFLKDTGLDYANIIDTAFNLAEHCSFIVSNNVIKDIFKTFTVPPTNKAGSCSYERLFGLYFILKNINTHNMENYVTKVSGDRL